MSSCSAGCVGTAWHPARRRFRDPPGAARALIPSATISTSSSGAATALLHYGAPCCRAAVLVDPGLRDDLAALAGETADDRRFGKNQVHLDLRTGNLDSEVARVQVAGGVLLTPEPVVGGVSKDHRHDRRHRRDVPPRVRAQAP